MKMKSAEEWNADWIRADGHFDSLLKQRAIVEAIREELRQECDDKLAKIGFNEQSGPRQAILNAGKPQFRKGQLVIRDGRVSHIVYPAEIDSAAVGWRPIKWSDLCDKNGTIRVCHTESGPVFLKSGM